MPDLSLPFINSLLLALLGLRLFSQRRHATAALAFIAACSLCSALVGLRWHGGFPPVATLQPLVASTLPALCWYCLRPRVNRQTAPGAQASYAHLLPIVITAVAIISRKMLALPLLDVILVTLYLGYGAALLRPVWHRAPGVRTRRRWHSFSAADRRRAGAGALLLFSAALDTAVALDFGLDRGAHAVYLVATGNLLTLFALAAIVALPVRTRHAAEGAVRDVVRAQDHADDVDERAVETGAAAVARAAETEAFAGTEDVQRAGRFDRLMREERPFAQPDLSIIKLAKRLGLSVRQLSSAINVVHGRNFSQIINEYRVNEAVRLLAETDDKITDIMLASGFQTKSNFNREFRRVTGVNPSEYRGNLRRRMPPDLSATSGPGNQ